MLSDNQKENFEYMAMGVAIGIGIGYVLAMYMIYL
jgi:hypothetical protein